MLIRLNFLPTCTNRLQQLNNQNIRQMHWHTYTYPGLLLNGFAPSATWNQNNIKVWKRYCNRITEKGQATWTQHTHDHQSVSFLEVTIIHPSSSLRCLLTGGIPWRIWEWRWANISKKHDMAKWRKCRARIQHRATDAKNWYLTCKQGKMAIIYTKQKSWECVCGVWFAKLRGP